MTEIYKSKGNWAPLHGVFDNDNKLWVLESSDKNDVRVTVVETISTRIDMTTTSISTIPAYVTLGGVVVGILILFKLMNFYSSLKHSKR